MPSCPLPGGALLNRYRVSARVGEAQAFTDCYSLEINRAVVLDDFVLSFYTTPLFKLERAILKFLVAKPSTDDEAKRLADGSLTSFAAWTVEDRTDNQLLMCDFQGRTRSWFMVEPISTTDQPRTKLYFGSAVVPVRNSKTGITELGSGFRFLLGFHKLYSKLLLRSAKAHL